MKKIIIIFWCGFLFAFSIIFLSKMASGGGTSFTDMFTKGIRLGNGDVLIVCFEKGTNASYQTPWGFACVFKRDMTLVAKTSLPVETLEDSMFKLSLSRFREEVVIFTDNPESGIQYTLDDSNFCEKSGYRLPETNLLGEIIYMWK